MGLQLIHVPVSGTSRGSNLRLDHRHSHQASWGISFHRSRIEHYVLHDVFLAISYCKSNLLGNHMCNCFCQPYGGVLEQSPQRCEEAEHGGIADG